MNRRWWLIAMVIYAAAAIADGTRDYIRAPSEGAQSSVPARLAVAFCAGLFWPIDLIARPMLLSSH